MVHHLPRHHLTPVQEQDQPMVSIATNQGRPQSQHSMQAQQHTPTQPGFPMDPNYELHNLRHQGFFQPNIAQGQPVVQEIAPRDQALQSLNHHIQSFMQEFGPSFEQNIAQAQPQPQLLHLSRPPTAQRPMTPANTYMPPHPSSAPQHRQERVLVDVAPMPAPYPMVPLVQIQSPASQEGSQLLQESFGSEYGYASSYASSIIDPSSPIRSPVRQNSLAGLPTLYEDISPVSIQAPFSDDGLLLTAATNTPDLRYMTDSPMRAPMSPREMMLSNLDIDASIEDTGISVEEVQQYISDQNQSDGKWTCLFAGCFKKFGRKENIKSHVQTHLGDRQFKCNHCGKCFVRQHDLKRHAKIHSGDKPHKCPCGNGFARQDALTRHRQRGVCEGALPGFEKKEVKRGRPRKPRPDMASRLDKATRTREMDARRGSQVSAYDSSSPSDRSYPDTPLNDNVESDPFAEFDPSSSTSFNAFIETYEETPPTSPAVIGVPSSTKAANREEINEAWFLDSEPRETIEPVTQFATPPRSSPPPMANSPVLGAQSSNDAFNTEAFDFGPLDTQPQACEPLERFSPAASSSHGSDFEHQSPENSAGAETFMGAQDILDFNNSMYGASDALFQASMEAWDFSQ